jgi:REP element-mobilizing transposase RayT
MSEKFRNKYRIPTARWQQWDYASEGIYFITICTKNRQHFFGEIIDGRMILNDFGKTVKNEWIKSVEIRPDMHLELGEFVVMPNHFHAVIMIGENRYNTKLRDLDGYGCGGDAMHCVSKGNRHENLTIQPKNQFGSQSKNLASIIRGFKSGVTTYSKKYGISEFQWQARYHDHVIRNPYSFERIQNYIINNPRNWKEDTFNKL